ncbi:hypothetical protein D3C87_1563100 [compost metagenome]
MISSIGAVAPELATARSRARGNRSFTQASSAPPVKYAMVMSGWFRSSTDLTRASLSLPARPNMQTLVAEYSTKSTTFRRSAVSASGLMVMSTWLAASTGTLVSCETGMAVSLTPSWRAVSLASNHAGPLQASPLLPDTSWISQGAFCSTPTRSSPALRIASTRGLWPGAGAVCAPADIDTACIDTASIAAAARRASAPFPLSCCCIACLLIL